MTAATEAGTTPSKHRAVLTLFAGNRDALEAMNQLALAVLRCEEAEIAGRQASPEGAVENAVVSAVKDAEERARVREEQMMRQNQAMFAQLAAMVNDCESQRSRARTHAAAAAAVSATTPAAARNGVSRARYHHSAAAQAQARDPRRRRVLLHMG